MIAHLIVRCNLVVHVFASRRHFEPDQRRIQTGFVTSFVSFTAVCSGGFGARNGVPDRQREGEAQRDGRAECMQRQGGAPAGSGAIDFSAPVSPSMLAP